jgi:hypothetical protein
MRRNKPVKLVTSSDVNDYQSFAVYCRQILGTPRPSLKEQIILQRELKRFFEEFENADWLTLCRLVDWCRAKRLHPADCYRIFCHTRRAWSDGVLAELDPVDRADVDLQIQIDSILSVERDPQWRRMLLGAQGQLGRESLAVYRREHPGMLR